MRWPPRARSGIRHVVTDSRASTLLSQPPRFIAYCLLIELTALFLTVVGITRSAQWEDARIFGMLALLGVTQAELSRQVERARRRIASDSPHINMSSVWTFAGVLLLSAPWITALTVVLYAHLALRSSYRLRRSPPFRMAFNASLVIVTCLVARGVLTELHFGGMKSAVHSRSGFVLLTLAAVVYFLVGALIALPGLRAPARSLQDAFGGIGDNLLELTTLGLGAISAVLTVAMPELLLAVVAPVLMLQRVALVSQLEIAATTDEKTGVLNTTGWHHVAARELARASRIPNQEFGVLMIDLDHFKRVNDRFGHIVGDQVLKVVADKISAAVREYDYVGRFGGEEFVVLLPGTAELDVHSIAERIRSSITTLNIPAVGLLVDEDDAIAGLSASIGVAMYPAAGSVIDRLLQSADTALYRAKSDGRNRVVTYLAAA